jgi:acyl-[acyl carrier protein]--UDP-N-acetylglucosamine O-acyltransferase
MTNIKDLSDIDSLQEVILHLLDIKRDIKEIKDAHKEIYENQQEQQELNSKFNNFMEQQTTIYKIISYISSSSVVAYILSKLLGIKI